MKKILTGLLAVMMLCLAACGTGAANAETAIDTDSVAWRLAGIDPAATMLTINDSEVSAELYLYWLQYIASVAAATEGCTDEEGNILWDHEIMTGITVYDYVVEETLGQARTFMVVEQMAEANGVTFTEEDEAAVDEEIAYYVEQVGGEEAYQLYLRQIGLSEASNRRLTRDYYLYEKLRQMTMIPDSALYISDEELYGYEGVTEDAVLVDHILFFTTGVAEEDQMKLETMEQARQTILELDGVEREKVFNYIADYYSDDTGRPYYPNGYLVTEDANFVQSFKDAALTLAVGEVSEVVTSEYGYHLLMRKDIRTYVAEDYLETILRTAMDRAQVTTSDAYNTLDVKAYCAAYAAELAAAADTTDEGETAAP